MKFARFLYLLITAHVVIFHESYTATLHSGNLPRLAVYGVLAVFGAKLQKVMRKTKDFVLFLLRWVLAMKSKKVKK